MKYTWKIQPAPVGRWRSFQHRQWPQAFYADERITAMILCEDDYTAERRLKGGHAPLKVRVADYSRSPWVWRTIKGTFATYEEAKDGLARCLAALPFLMPKEEVHG